MNTFMILLSIIQEDGHVTMSYYLHSPSLKMKVHPITDSLRNTYMSVLKMKLHLMIPN